MQLEMWEKNRPSIGATATRITRAHLGTVLMAHNRAGREIPKTTTVHHGMLPVGEDGVHLNATGQMILGKMTSSAVENFYKSKP